MKHGSILHESVMFTIATNGYVPYVRNLHASLARLGLAESLQIYSLDDEAHADLIEGGLPSLRLDGGGLSDWSDWNTPGFVKIVSFKYAAALEILDAGKNALYVDSDVVFLRNPFNDLQEVIGRSSADIILQYEAGKEVYNTGFWFARPTPGLIELFRRLRGELEEGVHHCDQAAFNDYMGSGLGVTAERLDPERYACGNQFLTTIHPKAPFYVDRAGRPFDFDAAYILHFNYVVGKEQKAWAMMKHASVFDSQLAELGRRGRWARPSGSYAGSELLVECQARRAFPVRIVYVLAIDERGPYSAMTRVSVASVRLSNPEARIAVVCDPHTDRTLKACGDPLPSEVDEWVVLDTPSGGARYRSRHLKTRLRHELSGAFLYIDGDTLVRGDLSPIFALDADVALAPNHSVDQIAKQIWIEDANDSAKMGWPVGDVPYLNGGVMYWADTSAAKRLATAWHDNWLANVERTGREVDQPALNAALREAAPRLHVLPHRYNAQLRANLRVSIDAVILHSYASDPSLPTAAEQLAAQVEHGGPIPSETIEAIVARRHPWPAHLWIDDFMARRVAKKGGLDDVYSLWLTGRRADGVRRWLGRFLPGRGPSSSLVQGGPS